MEDYNPEQLCEFLKKQVPDITECVLEAILTHKISGDVFMELNEEYLREIVPLLGDRLKLIKAIRFCLNFNSPVSIVLIL